MGRIIFALLAIVALAAPHAVAEGGSASQEPRVGLVIGNSAYNTPGWSLANPANDAHLIAASLQAVGFDVEVVTDASEKEMEAAFQRMGQRLAAAGPDATGFFFFAGHGVQSQGLNYLLPTDLVAYTEADVWSGAPRLELLMRHLDAAGNDANFIVLDACRNNPLPSSTRSAGRGLAAEAKTRGTLIAYATAPGSVAEDGTAGNSPFSQSLSALITQPGLPAETLFRRVATRVEEMTERRQQPWIESGLRGNRDFCFAGCEYSVAASAEQQTLDFALSTNSVPVLQAFLAQYPASASRALVEEKIAQLQKASVTKTTTAPATSPAVINTTPTSDGQDITPSTVARDGMKARLMAGDRARNLIDRAHVTFFGRNTPNIDNAGKAQLVLFAEEVKAHRLSNGAKSVRIIAGCEPRETSGTVCSMRAQAVQTALIKAGVSRDAFEDVTSWGRHRQLDTGDSGMPAADINRYAMIMLLD